MNENNQKPIKTFSTAGLKLSVWKNVIKKNEAESYISYSIKIQKTYLNEDNEWKTTESYNSKDLLMIAQLCEIAFNWIEVKKSELKEND